MAESVLVKDNPLGGENYYIPFTDEFEQMLISSERYACGRMSYIVGDTIRYIKRFLPFLSDRCITIMIHDIAEENAMCERSGGKIKMGMESDHQAWLAFKADLEKEQEARKAN